MQRSWQVPLQASLHKALLAFTIQHRSTQRRAREEVRLERRATHEQLTLIPRPSTNLGEPLRALQILKEHAQRHDHRQYRGFRCSRGSGC